MLTESKYKELKPYQGIIVFILFNVVVLFLSRYVPESWGLYGTALLQIIILLFAIIPVIILKADFKEVFPIKKPSIRQLFGVVVIWIASLLTVFLVSVVILSFFPEGMMDVSDMMQDLFNSVPMGVAFLIVSVMPAICEESLHRGFILSSFGPIKNKWIRVLIMGFIFGIFHLNLFRFLPTAILGMALTYIMIESENILLPMLFHFINNAFSTLISFANNQPVEVADFNPEMMIIGLAVFLIIFSGIPFLLLLGTNLIQKKKDVIQTEDIIIKKKSGNRNIIIAVICSALMVISGIVIMVINFDQFDQLGELGKFAVYIGLAEEAEIKGDYNEAINYYDKILETDDQNYTVLFYKAGAYYNLDEYEEAIKIYNEMMLIDDKDFELFWSMGLTYFYMDNYDMALEMLYKAIDLSPESFEIYLDIADTYRYQDDKQKAKEYYTKYLEHYPDDEYAKDKLLELIENE